MICSYFGTMISAQFCCCFAYIKFVSAWDAEKSVDFIFSENCALRLYSGVQTVVLSILYCQGRGRGLVFCDFKVSFYG
jgi:hypothetical protein